MRKAGLSAPSPRDNFNPMDSTPGDQCCWTNGYVSVTVQ